MNNFFEKIKHRFFNIRNYLFGKHYRLVIWSERVQENILHLEVLYIDNNFERNHNISGIYYDSKLDEDEVLQYLIELRDKYKIFELVETNYKFESSKILTKFIITKTEKLLFQF